MFLGIFRFPNESDKNICPSQSAFDLFGMTVSPNPAQEQETIRNPGAGQSVMIGSYQGPVNGQTCEVQSLRVIVPAMFSVHQLFQNIIS